MPTYRKLAGTCLNKYNYVTHFKCLKFYLQRGMKILKIHNLVRFKQINIYKNYIEFNTARRSAATNELDKAFYKQKNNSLFGKSMENVRSRLKVKVVTNEEKHVRNANKPTFMGSVLLADDLAIVKHSNANVVLKSTIAIGASVLELSK